MAPLEGAVLPPGSLILVTGANGFVGSHVADQFLKYGYKVRGTVRDANRSAWLASYFDAHHGAGKFELVEVKDLNNLESLTKAMEGCAGVAATASDLSFSPNPEDVIPVAVAIVTSTLEAAAATPSVRRLVLTSSSSAAPFGITNKEFDLGVDDFNVAAVEEAWSPPSPAPDQAQGQGRAVAVYAASKVAQEEELRRFMAERGPGFAASVVLPDFVIGRILSVENQGFPSSAGMMKAVWEGGEGAARSFAMLPPHYEIDAADVAALHVAAVLHPDVKGERIFGYANHKNWTITLQLLRELYPGRQFPDPPRDEGQDLANVVGRPRAEELLRWVKGSGWTSYKDSLRLFGEALI